MAILPESFELLTKDNWDKWKNDIRILLLDKGSWKFIENETEEIDKNATFRDKEEYDLRKSRAFSTIYYAVSPEFRPLIQDCNNGKEAWKILKDQFEPKTRARVIQLLDEFFNIRYSPSEEMGLFIARIKQSVKKLNDAGYPLDGLFQGFQMIRHLPQEYLGIVQLIYRWPNEDFTVEKIAEELIREESRLKQMMSDSRDNEVSAFNVSNRSKKVNKSTRNLEKSQVNKKQIGPCHICKSYGHLMSQCRQNREKKYPVRNITNKTMLVENFASSIVKSKENDKQIDKFNWVFDTAATSHFCNNKNLMTNFEEMKDVNMALAVGNSESKVLGKGKINFDFKIDGKINSVTLENVLYNPNLRRNLLSGTQLEKEGAVFVGKNGQVLIYKNHQKLCYAKRQDGLYIIKPFKYNLENQTSISSFNISANKTNKMQSIDLWHRRFCHVNFDYLVNTSSLKSVKGLPRLYKPGEKCESCILAKQNRISFPPLPGSRSRKILDLVYMDVCGALPTLSKGGNRYFLVIVDDYSRFVTVNPMKTKDEVFDKFKIFQKRMERLTGNKIVAIRSDNGGEFRNRKFEKYLEIHGIKAERTNTYTPEQNICERFNRTALDAVKAMLKASKMGNEWWAEAVCCFTHTWNRICHKGNLTPYEMFFSRKPSVIYFKVFGCKAYVGVPKQKRNKLQMRATEGIMVGYAINTKGYRIWLIKEQKTIETCNVKFDEMRNAVEDVLDPKPRQLKKYIEENRPYDYDDDGITNENETGVDEEQQELTDSNDTPVKSTSDLKWLRKAKTRPDESRTDVYYYLNGSNTRFRSHNDVERYCNAHNIKFEKEMFDFNGKNKYSGEVQKSNEANLTEIYIPQSYKEAIKSKNSNDWKKAMEDEINTMEERRVWKLVDKPENKNILGNKWVYSVKRNERNEIVRFKARLVAQGYKQKKGEDFEDVYSPVVNFSIIRAFFAILVCLYGWTNCQLDVKNAYLAEKIYMSQPEGFVKGNNKVCLLHKALYGLHESGREWFQEFEKVLKGINFRKISWCNCVYKGTDTILLIYVDDIVIFGKDDEAIEKVIKQLSKIFDIRVLGKTRKLLGIEFCESEKGYFIHQQSYIEEVYEKFKEYKIPISSLPIAKGTVLSKSDCPKHTIEIEEMKNIPYRNLLGCLTFISNRTRPDIAYALNILSQFQENPGMHHWEALLKLLGYLMYTKDYKLNLASIDKLEIHCFSDADYAANRDDRVSLGGLILYIDRVPVVWRTYKQKCISLSTMEAEYVSLAEASKELVWFKNILSDEILDLKLESCFLYCDNKSAIDFSKSEVENNRTKHIDVKYHFIRQLVSDSVFELKFVYSKKNDADMFTKPVTKADLEKFSDRVYSKE